MFKTLVLSALYNLSDDQIEYQVRDRLSFMRFLVLDLGDRVPDVKTVWLYRDALAQAGQVEDLFRQFDGHRRGGAILRGAGRYWMHRLCRCRATTTRATKAQPSRRARCCEDWENKPAKRSQKDVDARFNPDGISARQSGCWSG